MGRGGQRPDRLPAPGSLRGYPEFRISVLVGPVLAFLLTRVMCHALADRRHDEEMRGQGTGRIVMSPQDGYTEIREPAHRQCRQRRSGHGSHDTP